MNIKCYDFFGCKETECPMRNDGDGSNCWEVEPANTIGIYKSAEPESLEIKQVFCQNCLYYAHQQKLKSKEMSEKDLLSYREKRRSLRVPAPKKATAIFKNEKGGIDRIQIKDLSLSGMLISGANEGVRYYAGTVINNIYLNIYVAALDTDSKFYIYIAKGEIVRSFIDEASQTLNYGIEFSHNYSDEKYKLKKIINILAPDSYQ